MAGATSVALENLPEALADTEETTAAFILKLPYHSGNPSVEVTKGIIHLFKEDKKVLLNDSNRSLVLCMTAVPAYRPLHDVLQFIAPFLPHSEHIRVIRDSGKLNTYMVLLRFRSQKATDEFYEAFNGKPFNSIEGDVCQLSYVAKVEVFRSSEGHDDDYDWTAGASLTGHTELPTCAVCLERMDETVSGVLTILCNHSFHDTCLAKWRGDNNTCPVCRYFQTPEAEEPNNSCQVCGVKENLWICLLCGYVGCGRHEGGHAYTHYMQTEHTFAMELESNSVWDYAGDNYVHRLVQNKTDGKLVQLELQSGDFFDEKIDSLQLEYSHLITSQLEKQRHHFEESLEEQAKEATKQIEELKEKTRIAVEERKQLETKMTQVTKERDAVRRKLDSKMAHFAAVKKELDEERQLSQCLLADQKSCQAKLLALEETFACSNEETNQKIAALEKRLHSMMLFLEAGSVNEV